MILTVLQIIAIILVTLPLSLGATVAGQLRFTQPVFFWIGYVWGKLLLRIGGVTLTVHGAQKLDPHASYVLVSNHASLYDIAALLGGLRLNICFVLKRELTRVPIWGWGMIRSPYVIVDRSSLRDARRSVDTSVRRLREGARAVLFFPEGTRTRNGAMQPFKRGAFNVATAAGVPVVPITVNGSFRILPRDTFRINRGHIEVIVHQPIPPSGMTDVELLAKVEEAIRRAYVEQK
jgi:1-acyl-sn-glycerol-3-phosphate acyltransferase